MGCEVGSLTPGSPRKWDGFSAAEADGDTGLRLPPCSLLSWEQIMLKHGAVRAAEFQVPAG